MKKILSLMLALCALMMFTPPSVSAEGDYKGIYFNFLKDNVIKQNSHWRYAILADLNLDGTPELIMYDSGATVSCGIYIFQIIDGNVQLRYAGGYMSNEYIKGKDYLNYFDSSITNGKVMGNPPSTSSETHTFSLRKNKSTGELIYVHFSRAGGIDFNEETLLWFSGDKILNASDRFYSDIEKDEETLEIISSDYYIDGSNVSEGEYNQAYSEFLAAWQDTGYDFAYLDIWSNSTETDIRNFLNSYIPENQALGLVDTTTPSDWAKTEIDKAVRYGLIDSDGNYVYQNNITREQFAELIVTCVEQLTGSGIKPNGNHKFVDTNNNNMIEKAYTAGIVNGVSDTEFAPDNNITRQEIAVMMYRAIKYVDDLTRKSYLKNNNTSLNGYSDSGNVADWAKESVAVLVNNKIVNGTSDTTLSPLANTTVEQAIALDVRIYDLMK